VAVQVFPVCSDEEAPLPYADATFDLVVSSLSMHWINDVPGALREILRVLKPDGALIATVLGGDTLEELRCVTLGWLEKSAIQSRRFQVYKLHIHVSCVRIPAPVNGSLRITNRRSSFVVAEQALYGGVSPHVSPMMGMVDVGNLLVEAGFSLPSVDVDTFTIEYPDASAVMRHLQRMGESNASVHMLGGARRRLIEAAKAEYHSSFANPNDGSVPATFQLVHMIGWKPAPSQPVPKARGSVPSGFGHRKTPGGSEPSPLARQD
jgi:NADH dehydrogenase [ubiquinone] 1 alpha subcomplex assembly factor 5